MHITNEYMRRVIFIQLNYLNKSGEKFNCPPILNVAPLRVRISIQSRQHITWKKGAQRLRGDLRGMVFFKGWGVGVLALILGAILHP